MLKRCGKLITFEGSEGSGKSTQIKLIHKHLRSLGKDVVFVREPGGVKISEKIRRILLDVRNQDMTKECETLLYMASRAQLVEEVVKPALEKGKIVLCDRFLDSTIVYQGFGFGVDIDMISMVGRFATQDIQPDLTFLFDLSLDKAFSRITRKKDRIELRPRAYHNRVRKGYLELAKKDPKRIKVIPVDRSRNAIHEIVREYVEVLMKVENRS